MEGVITVATPFNGKWYAIDSYLRALENLDFDKKNIHLIFYDNSKDEKFGKYLKDWLKKNEGYYNSIDYIQDYSEGHLRKRAKISTQKDYSILDNVARVYREMQKNILGEYTFLVEDDIVIPKNSLKKLIKNIKKKNVAAVGGYYLDRWASKDFVSPYVWQYYNKNKRKDGLLINAIPKKEGVEEVIALGMGCYLAKTDVVKKLGFSSRVGNFKGADIILGAKINEELKMKTLVDWSIRCPHIHYKNGKIIVCENKDIEDLQIKTINRIIQQIEVVKQEDINKLTKSLKEKDEIIKTKDNSIMQKDEIMKEKDRHIRKRDKIIKTKDSHIKERDKTIKEKGSLIENLNIKIQERQEEIKKIHNSRGWKFLTAVHKIKKGLGMVKDAGKD